MTDTQLQYAGFWRRFLACLIDGILIVLPSYFITKLVFSLLKFILPGASAWTFEDYANNQLPYYVTLISGIPSLIFLCFAFAWFFACYKWQATPGKRIMKVYVVNKDGSKVSYRTGFLRTFLPAVLYWTVAIIKIVLYPIDIPQADVLVDKTSLMLDCVAIILLLVWYLAIVFTKEKTAVHDMILGTRVVRGKVGN
jgi:uncharacterized RDD family membrane protein YckC